MNRGNSDFLAGGSENSLLSVVCILGESEEQNPGFLISSEMVPLSQLPPEISKILNG